MDYAAGTRMAMEHLIGLGHTEIGFIGFAGSEKYEAFWQKLEAAGLHYNPRYVQFLQASELVPGILAGYESMQKLIAGGRLPTAVLITNDYVAVGAMEALSIAGISVPQEISLVGFDDLAQSSIALTTLKADLVELGRIAARLLLDQIAGHADTAGTVVPLDLLVRGSTAPPLRVGETVST
jgi:LacI family transcriptional regulator